MSFLNYFFLIMLSLLMASCKSAHYRELMEPAVKAKLADTNLHPVFDGEIEPPLPDPDDNSETVLGIDINNNGIRDDIEIWINRNALDSNERKAFRQLAFAMTEVMKALNLKQDSVISKKVEEKLLATSCYNYIVVLSKKPKGKRLDEKHNPNTVIDWLINLSTQARIDTYNRKRIIHIETTNPFIGAHEGWKACQFSVIEKER